MKPVKSDVSFPALESSVLQFWKDQDICRKGLDANADKPPFVFYDGPPFATGLPHYGHLLPGTLKDIVPRYWVMKGRHVKRRWGWDCHGLPVEFEMEKELGLAGRHEVEEYGVGRFNEACRGIVSRYTKEWQQVIERTGRWVDFENSYRTMDTSFMESVWWVFNQLWEKGLIFEGHRVMPYSWRISTPLSNFEAGLNYKEVQDPAVTVRLDAGDNRFFLIWTTTPWTLPSNLAVAVNPELDYVEVKDESGAIYVLAKDRLGAYYKEAPEVVREFKGKELVGQTYEPLFDFFADRKTQGAFKVLSAEYVTATDGTGIVHQAPAFGEDDFEVCKQAGIELVDPVDGEGNFTDLVPPYKGQNIKDADKAIVKDLKEKGALVRHDTLNHSYPFCWRSDTPLIYKAISTWFVKMEPLKGKLVENNKSTHWVPEHLRDGRFGNWLENARDWNISRNRFWGTPLPVWRCDAEGCDFMECIGSIQGLTEKSGTELADIHKHYVDDVTFDCKQCHGTMRRIPEVLDCWFESGSMPYGQNHYPFENKKYFENNFPADFIAEGVDQTRGWFYTLSVLSTALLDCAPFKNVIVNGLVLAEDGKKMSKRLKNYPDPSYILDTYGADALRAYLTTSPAAHAQDLRFSEVGVKEVIRSVLLPYWNAYSFFVTYATADGWEPKDFDPRTLDKLEDELDRWVVSRLQSLVRVVDEKMEVYHLYEVVPEVIGFIDELTNWYIRLNRRRFWQEGDSESKKQAYATLYYVLAHFSRVLAPILPFITEEIHQNLKLESDPESVHLCPFPEVNTSWVDRDLEKQMALVRDVVFLGRAGRSTSKIKNRQPLQEIKIITQDDGDKATVERYQELIRAELNVKEVSFSSDESQWVDYLAKPNSKILGPKLGKKFKEVMKAIREMSPAEVAVIETQGYLEVAGERLSPEEVLLERTPKKEGAIQTQGGITVWLDTALSDTLLAEGQAREMVNRIQRLRKEMDFNVTDRIRISYHSDDALHAVVQAHRDYITAETLADALDRRDESEWHTEQKIDEFPLKLRVERL